MASLMDEYPMPGMEQDPRELERLKYLTLMRMGLGMAGKEPIGSAMQAGINTMFAGQEDARRNADQRMQEMRAKMQYAAGMKKQEEEARKQAGMMSLLDKMDPAVVQKQYGITPFMLETAKLTGDIAPILKTMEAYTAKEGDVRMVGNAPLAVRAKDGIVPVMSDGVEVGGVMQPGYLANLAAREGVTTAARTANTPQQLGLDTNNRPQFGYPESVLGAPPAMRQQMPVQTNFSGTPQQIAEARAIAAQDMARQGLTVGADPLQQKMKEEFGTKSLTDWFAIGKDTAESAALASHIKAKVGVMRDVLQQPGRPEGLLGPFTVAAQQLGASIGLPTDNLPASELFQSLTTQIALTVRNPQGDMGLPGSASNQDFTRLIASAPNMSQSERGQKLMVESYDAMSTMAMKKSELWAELNARIDAGEIRPAQARQEYTKAITPYALEATRAIRAAIKESDRIEKQGSATGATAAPSTQNAIRLREISKREEEIRRRLGQ